MAVFPNISRGSVCLYPLTRSLASPTSVLRMADDSEVRWQVAGPLDGFVLQYARLSAADKDTLKAFFEARKGRFDSTWTFPLPVGGVTTNYTNMVFVDDEFSCSRAINNTYSVTLKIKQTVSSETVGALGAFPATRQAPFVAASVYETIRNQMPSGKQYAWANRAASRKRYVVNLPLINETELAAFLAHYIAAGGRWLSFNFTDPNDSTVHVVRYDQDELQARYNSLRNCALSVALLEVAA